MEKGENLREAKEEGISFACKSCGELLSCRLDVSKHFVESSCGNYGSPSVSSGSQVLALSSEGKYVTVSRIQTVSWEGNVKVKEEDVTTHCESDTDTAEKNNVMVDKQEDGDLLPSGVVSVVTASAEDDEGVSSRPITVSLLTHVMPHHVSSDHDVMPATLAIPVSEVQSTVPSGSLFVTQESGILNLVSDEGKNLAVIPRSLSSLSRGEDGQIDPSLTEIQTPTHLPPSAIIGPVAMEIHIPVHSQLIVGNCVKSKEDEKNALFHENKEMTDKPTDKNPESVLNVPQISRSRESQRGKVIKKHHHKKGVKGSIDMQRFCCEVCGKTFSKSSNLYRHKRIHTGKTYPCSDCDKEFRYKETLKTHKIFFHNKNDPLHSSLNKCRFCHRLFASTSGLGIHLRTHTYDKPVSCHDCDRTFMTATGLKRHQLIHTGKKDYECDICKKKFLWKSSLVRHKFVHSANKPFKCSHCLKTFADKSACSSHEKLHSEERPFACRYCLKSFRTASKVERHETIHTRLKTHACSKCSDKFGTSKDLQMHLREHWKSELKKGTTLEANQCKECGAKFTQRVTLRAHERTHTGEFPYSCEICLKSFAYYSSWRRHSKMHKGEKPYSCKKCGKGFTKKVYLSRHKSGFCIARQQKLKKHRTTKEVAATRNTVLQASSQPPTEGAKSLAQASGKKGDKAPESANAQQTTIADKASTVINEMNRVTLQPFACELCGKMYKTNSSLQRHLKTHTNKKPFICDICGKGFSRRPVLEDHKMMVHDVGFGNKRATYQCTDCIKSYPSLKRLEIHRRMHTGERPHKCPLCEKCFKETSALKRHLQVHVNTKPFKCVVCSRGFNDKGNLQKHEATHGIHGEEGRSKAQSWTPFSCAECGKTFKQLGYLRYHERMHHVKESHCCHVCGRTFCQAANLKVHVKSHAEKTFKCTQCTRAYRRESKLEKHIATCHNARQSFACAICSKVLATKASLKRHVETHSGAKPRMCLICRKTFRKRHKLKRHLRKHKEEVFLCDKCDMSFLSKDQFQVHESSHH